MALPIALPWLGQLELQFARQASLVTEEGSATARSALVRNWHRGPLLVQKALYPEGPGVCHVVLVHPPAGVAAGDKLSIDIQVAEGAHAVVSTPSATRWYKSNGEDASQQVRLSVAAGSCLEWLPEENLFYEQVRAVQTLNITVQQGAKLIAWDAFMLGRASAVEDWRSGSVRLLNRLFIGEQLAYAEQGSWLANDRRFNGAVGLAGMRCGATLLAFGGHTSEALLERIEPVLPYGEDLRAGCSLLAPGLIMMRILGREAFLVRTLLQEIWSAIRHDVVGIAPQSLRLWAC